MATDHPSETAGAIEETELLQGSSLRQRKREKYLEFLNPLYWIFSQCILLANWANLTCIPRRQWHPTPVLLPGKSHGQRSLIGCSPWSREESTSERLHFHFSLSCTREGNGNRLQFSCLENPRDGGACWAAVYGVAQSRTRLNRLSSSSSNMYPADMRVWDTHLTADKLPTRQNRIRERHKIVPGPIGSRNGTNTMVTALAGQRGSIQELINYAVKEGNEQWIPHTSIWEWTKQEEKKGRKSRRKEGRKERRTDERKEEKTDRREDKRK